MVTCLFIVVFHYIVLFDSLTTYSSKNFLKENLYLIEED